MSLSRNVARLIPDWLTLQSKPSPSSILLLHFHFLLSFLSSFLSSSHLLPSSLFPPVQPPMLFSGRVRARGAGARSSSTALSHHSASVCPTGCLPDPGEVESVPHSFTRFFLELWSTTAGQWTKRRSEEEEGPSAFPSFFHVLVLFTGHCGKTGQMHFRPDRPDVRGEHGHRGFSSRE